MWPFSEKEQSAFEQAKPFMYMTAMKTVGAGVDGMSHAMKTPAILTIMLAAPVVMGMLLFRFEVAIMLLIGAALWYGVFGPTDSNVTIRQSGASYARQQLQAPVFQQPEIPEEFRSPPAGHCTKYNPSTGQFYFFKV